MNYFELHIGDYEAATAHLSMLEDAAYCRMLRIYYRTEKPLPADTKQVCRLVRAASKPERDAVEQVLQDFFTLEADGWHQRRADDEIGQYQAGEPEREAKKANEDRRVRAHREERAALFNRLTEAGQHAAWNIGIKELRALVAALQAPRPATPATEPVTRPATAPATPATATQTPDTTSQTPDTREVKTMVAPAKAAPTDPPAAPPLKAKDLEAEGVDPQKAADWLLLRKAKRLPLTATAWADTKAEGVKAGLNAAQTVASAVANNWAGFKAAWLTRDSVGKGQQPALLSLDGVH